MREIAVPLLEQLLFMFEIAIKGVWVHRLSSVAGESSSIVSLTLGSTAIITLLTAKLLWAALRKIISSVVIRPLTHIWNSTSNSELCFALSLFGVDKN